MTTKTNWDFWRNVAAAGALGAAILVVPVMADAGECPADKVRAGTIENGATEAVGVTDMVLSHIDLSKEKLALSDRLFRLRRLHVQPGGVVPQHSHSDRPALIYIVEGSITEYSSNCAVPIEHKAGETAMESIGLSHWWRNNGKEPVVLLSADILHTEMKDDHMM